MHPTRQAPHDSACPAATSIDVPWELAEGSSVSIRAERAWDVSRGDPGVTIAIIDEAFDLAALPSCACVKVAGQNAAVGRQVPRPFSHGTRLAHLICGDPFGYPGVAPRCRLLLVGLPALCTEEEEERAFLAALASDAAVVCCGWGPPGEANSDDRRMPHQVSRAVARVARESRGGLGALVLFAAGHGGGNVQLDGYVSHPLVTAVGGITGTGALPRRLDFGSKIEIAAPVSAAPLLLGGSLPVPPGASGAVALAAGVAGIVLSVMPGATAATVGSILKRTSQRTWRATSRSRNRQLPLPVLDASAAVAEAMRNRVRPARLRPRATVPSPSRGRRAPSENTPGEKRIRERRFNGGEHSFFGLVAANMLQTLYAANAYDPQRCFFGSTFQSFAPPSGSSSAYQPQAKACLDRFFTPTDPRADWAIPSVNLSTGTAISPIAQGGYPSISNLLLPFGYLIGLAADVYSDPIGLLSVINTASNSPQAQLLRIERPELEGLFTTLTCFRDEIVSNFEVDHDGVLIANSLTSGGQSFIKLAWRNYSHFAGHNLLFYLSYHLWATSEAMRCANAQAQALADSFFNSALAKEAFALHYLTDMFSAGHTRVPRWAFLHAGLQDASKNAIDSDVIANLLHNHEGRLGCLVRNTRSTVGGKNFVWKTRGDGSLNLKPGALGATDALIYAFSSGDSAVSGATYADESPNFSQLLPSALQQASPLVALRSFDHVCSLVCSSLADVFRHMASGLTLDESGVDATTGRIGLLGSILAQVPYAMPTAEGLDSQGISAGLATDIMNKLYGSAYSNTQLTDRLRDVTALYKTWKGVWVPKWPKYWSHNLVGFITWYWTDRFADPTGGTASSPLELSWLAAQTKNFSAVFGSSSGSNLSKTVPAILAGTTNLPFTGVQAIDITKIPTLPPSWVAAVPGPMMDAFSSSPCWGIVT